MKKILQLLILCVFINANAQTPITSTIPYQGFGETQATLGQAEFQILLDNTTGVLDKPIILVDGFDPTDTRNLNQMYELLGFGNENMGDVLRDEGFDFVLLNFPVYTNENDAEVDGGVDFIQRNAMSLVELINQINTLKVGNEELVVIGPSMGGLISRYALRYMEQNSLDHQTRLYISWDTPHLGANIPIGFQYLFNYIAVQANNEQIQALIDSAFNSPASKQMLIDHYQAHLQSGSNFEQDPSLLLPIGATNYRDAFQSEIDAMGFPQDVRNIAVSNGGGIGVGIGSPSANVIDATFDVPNLANTTIDILVNFTPAANQSIEVTSAITRFLGVPVASFSANSLSPPNNDGLDAAPGGKYDISSFAGAAQGNPILEDFINNLNQESFCFIPTISSLAITNEDDFHNSPDIGAIHDSPFVTWHIPDDNQDHITITQLNVDYVLPEIRNQVAGINDTVFANKYKLKGNPVSNALNIQLSNQYNYNNVNMNIVNSTGQKLFSTTYHSVSNEINIPINFSSGVYFLTISDNQTTINKKFIVK